MTRLNQCALFLITLAVLFGCPQITLAAQSHDSCTGYITAVPAAISTPGIWCLNQNMNSSLSDTPAIEISANDVTIDCNGFWLDNLAAGNTTTTSGIHIPANMLHPTVRRCVVSGFHVGLLDDGSTKLTVEDNHFDRNYYDGIIAFGSGAVVRRNRISNTGGSYFIDSYSILMGIAAGESSDVRDNVISGVTALNGSGATIWGIFFTGSVGSVSGNRVRGLATDGAGRTAGIYSGILGARVTIRNNVLIGDGSVGSLGLHCEDSLGRFKNNAINGFATATENCGNAGGNDISN
jgi:hypothetical protein